MAAMLLYAVQNTQLEIITQNFLESGHSHMECDSMHSAIESEKKYIDVYSMIDWVSIFRRARRRNPFKVIQMHHKMFFDLQRLAADLMKNRRRDTEGNIVNWLLVKCFRFEKGHPGVVFYRYNYSDDFKQINVYGRGRPILHLQLTKADHHQMPISEAKKKDLLKLCTQPAIPKEMHGWYKDLPTVKQTRDRLPEPGVDDSGDDDDDGYNGI